MRKKKIKRNCLVCGKKIYSTVYENGRYTNGHYFGKIQIPVEGTGKHKTN